jgi:hypothetical protein
LAGKKGGFFVLFEEEEGLGELEDGAGEAKEKGDDVVKKTREQKVGNDQHTKQHKLKHLHRSKKTKKTKK